MTTIRINVSYDPKKLPGNGEEEQIGYLILPMAEFVEEMQAIGCAVNMTVNGQPLTLPAYPSAKEQAS